MLNVFFTVDVEIWCDGWLDIDAKFPAAFDRYIYGKTPKGSFGLPFQLQRLRDFDLRGVFFVEPMFSARFGVPPLQEIVDLIRTHEQDVQLHLHTEWVDEARSALLPNCSGKRQFMRDFSLDEQTLLVSEAKRLMRQAGCSTVSAFRAGSFGFNADTLVALNRNEIYQDASYNATLFGLDSGVAPGITLSEPAAFDGVIEYPMTVFEQGNGRLRHVQLAACSKIEMESLLWQALEAERRSFVILSHNFELLAPSKDKVDRIVLDRFEWLCNFLNRNKDSFRTCDFGSALPVSAERQPAPLKSTRMRTLHRTTEQLARRAFFR